MRHLSSENTTTLPPLAANTRAWRRGAALALLLALALTLAIPPAHAAPLAKENQPQPPSHSTEQSGVAPADLSGASVAQALVNPNTVTNCLGVSLSVQSNFPGGSVTVTLSFTNNCGQAVRNITWTLSSSVACTHYYTGHVAGSGGLGTTSYGAGAHVNLLNHVYPSACQLYDGTYQYYLMSTTGRVNGLMTANTANQVTGSASINNTLYI